MSALPVDRLREVVADRFPEAKLVVLFGSLARGEGAPWSDADIAVSGLEYWRELELGAALGSILGREAHVVSLDAASDWLRYHAAVEGIVLQGAEVAWPSFVAGAMVRFFDLAPIIRLCSEGARRQLRGAARDG